MSDVVYRHAKSVAAKGQSLGSEPRQLPRRYLMRPLMAMAAPIFFYL